MSRDTSWDDPILSDGDFPTQPQQPNPVKRVPNKYLIIGLAAFILETASTMYIATVADRSIAMIFWAFIGPFLGLPFVGYMVESKSWPDRFKMALASAVGYVIGATIIYILNI
jgi:hypothetical protein